MLGKETPMAEMKNNSQSSRLPPSPSRTRVTTQTSTFQFGWSVISTTRQLRRSPPITEPSSLPGVFFST